MEAVSDERAYRRLGDRIREGQAVAFVGRTRELDLLRRWARPDVAPAVVAVHGPAGMGKTALMSAFVGSAEGGDAVTISCRDLEPTPVAVLAELADRLDTAPDTGAIGAALDEASLRILVLDDVDRLHLVDGWLRTELLPSFPTTVTTLLVGRIRRGPAWATAPGWQGLVAELPLGPLSGGEARRLLEAVGVPEADAPAVVRFAAGHPLALRLAAANPSTVHEVAPGAEPRLVEDLVDCLLDGLPAADVRIVQAASFMRRVLESDLADLLADDDLPGDASSWWSRLRDLPFTEITPDGLELSDLVRDSVRGSFATRDPGRFAVLRSRAVKLVRRRLDVADPGWSRTADMLHLVDDPTIRDGFFPPDAEVISVETATPQDRPAIDAITEGVDGDDALRWAARWLDAHPGSVRVARGRDRSVLAYQSVVRLSEAEPWTLRGDPVGAVWSRHLDRSPLGPEEEALLVRRALGDAGECASPALAALFIDIKRSYVELRPRLRRVYVARGPSPGLTTMFERMGFESIGLVELDGVDHEALVLDFGPGSVDGWLARLLDLPAPGPPGSVDVGDRDDTEPLLTDRERQVLALVAQGATNKDVATALAISPKTVGRHLENAFTKLGVTNRAAAVRVAVERHLIG